MGRGKGADLWAHAAFPSSKLGLFQPRTIASWPSAIATIDALAALGAASMEARATVGRSFGARLLDTAIGLFYPFRATDHGHSLTSRRTTALYGQLYEFNQLNQATLDAMPEMFGRATAARSWS